MSKPFFIHKQSGFLTLATLALIVVFGILGISVAYMFIASSTSTINFQLGSKAFYLAEAGLENATRELLTPVITGTPTRIACSAVTGDANLTNSSALGTGTAYTVTASGPFYATPTTLNGALTAGATTITVVSTTNYQNSGRIMIDRELINYVGKTATSFIGVTRGADGTTAASHTTGTPIAQFQCNLTASGGIPNLSSPTNKRVLTSSVQLQEAWTVGVNSGGSFIIGRWNYPTALSWNSASLASGSATTLNGISMISDVDGWAVGNARRFLHWDGSAWTLTSVAPNVNYNGVYCISADLCFAVGDNSGGGVVLSWNGTAWSRPTVTGLQTNDLNAISCGDSNNCWAVGSGTSTATRIFYRYASGSWSTLSVNGTFNTSFPFTTVNCSSSSDCWAAGANATFARWNGSSWSAVATGLPAVQYNSLFCNNGSDCWVVGNNSGGDMIAHYDGASWTRSGPYAALPNVNLSGVTCANANDCWAVGVNSGGELTIHWDGTTWSRIGPSAAIADVNLMAIDIVHPNSQPEFSWAESYP